MLQLITQTVQLLGQLVTSVLVPLAAAATIAMALLEAYKKLLRKRARYHEAATWAWCGEMTGRDAYRELVQLTTGVPVGEVHDPSDTCEHGDAPFGVFALDLPQMVGQFQEAVDIALRFPVTYADLFEHLTRGVDDDDVEKWQTCVEAHHAHTAAVAAGKDAGDPPAPPSPEVYAKLKALVDRRLDAFHVQTQYAWDLWNQKRAVPLGAVILYVALIWTAGTGRGATGGWGVPAIEQWLLLGVVAAIGGLLAPMAKDGLSALKSFKKS